MRSYYKSIAAIVLLVLVAQPAFSQDGVATSAPSAVGDSLRITVVMGNTLDFEFAGKVTSIEDGVVTINKPEKTAVINSRWPYLCHLPIVGERFFTYTTRRPMEAPQEIRIETQKQLQNHVLHASSVGHSTLRFKVT